MDRQEKIKILRDLIKIRSVNGNEYEMSAYLAHLLDKHQIAYQIQKGDDNRSNLIAEIGSGHVNNVLAFTGHQDTVKVPDEQEWKYLPFAAKIVGDKIFGRGAADMKSGLAAEIISLIELKDNDAQVPGKIRLIFTFGEEFGAPGAYQIKPDELSDVNAMVVGEATNGNVIYAHSGSLNYQIDSIGTAVHSSRPEDGVNAISGLVDFINEEPKLFADAAKDDILGQVKHSVNVIGGGSQVNILAADGYLQGNVRPTKAVSNQEIIDKLKDLVRKLNQTHDYHLEFKLIHNFYPVETNSKDNFVQTAWQAAKADYHNLDPQLCITNGATDASVFVQTNPKMAVVLLGPENVQTAHQRDEFTTISSYLDTINAYEDISRRYFAEK